MLQQTEDNGSDHVRREPYNHRVKRQKWLILLCRNAIRPCSRAIPAFETTCCMQMINFGKNIFTTIFFIESLCLAAHCVPFHFEAINMRRVRVPILLCDHYLFFFPPCWLFGCRVDLRSFVSVVMFFFSADVVFVTLLKMKILVNVWNCFFSLTEFMSSHLRIPVICPVLIYARCPFVCAHKYIERIYKWGKNGSSHQQAYTEQIEKEIARERERGNKQKALELKLNWIKCLWIFYLVGNTWKISATAAKTRTTQQALHTIFISSVMVVAVSSAVGRKKRRKKKTLNSWWNNRSLLSSAFFSLRRYFFCCFSLLILIWPVSRPLSATLTATRKTHFQHKH